VIGRVTVIVFDEDDDVAGGAREPSQEVARKVHGAGWPRVVQVDLPHGARRRDLAAVGDDPLVGLQRLPRHVALGEREGDRPVGRRREDRDLHGFQRMMSAP
jgi:hypothetical protein